MANTLRLQDEWWLEDVWKVSSRSVCFAASIPTCAFLSPAFTSLERFDGELWPGPYAVLGFARESYRRRDVNLRGLAATLANRGVRRVARRYLETKIAGRASPSHPFGRTTRQ